MKKIVTLFFLQFFLIGLHAQFNSIKFSQKIESISIVKPINKDIVIDSTFAMIKDSLNLVEDTLNAEVISNEDERKQFSYFSLPLKNIYITSKFGNRLHPIDGVYKFHYGIDLRANSDTVYSVYNSKVLNSGYSNKLGHFIEIEFGEYKVIYGHLKYYFYKAGDIINSNTAIGITGNTGKSTAPHLHFSVKRNNKHINPITFISNIMKANNVLYLSYFNTNFL